MESRQETQVTVNAALTAHDVERDSVNSGLHSPEAKLLRELHVKLGSWEKVGTRVGVNRGLAWMVATGKIQSPTVSTKLSLDFRPVEESSDCRFLRLIRSGAVPWLRAREDLRSSLRQEKP